MVLRIGQNARSGSTITMYRTHNDGSIAWYTGCCREKRQRVVVGRARRGSPRLDSDVERLKIFFDGGPECEAVVDASEGFEEVVAAAGGGGANTTGGQWSSRAKQSQRPAASEVERRQQQHSARGTAAKDGEVLVSGTGSNATTRALDTGLSAWMPEWRRVKDFRGEPMLRGVRAVQSWAEGLRGKGPSETRPARIPAQNSKRRQLKREGAAGGTPGVKSSVSRLQPERRGEETEQTGRASNGLRSIQGLDYIVQKFVSDASRVPQYIVNVRKLNIAEHRTVVKARHGVEKIDSVRTCIGIMRCLKYVPVLKGINIRNHPSWSSCVQVYIAHCYFIR